MSQQLINMYQTITSSSIEPNRDSYEFAYRMLTKIRRLFHGKLSKLQAVQQLFETLAKDASAYESFFEACVNQLDVIYSGKGLMALPIFCLNTMGADAWHSSSVDSTRKNFDSLETKLRHTIEEKSGLIFTMTTLKQALYCFVDFYMLVNKMTHNQAFLEKISKKEFHLAKADYDKALAALMEEFLSGLEELQALTQKNDSQELEPMKKVQLVTIDELFDKFLDTLPWHVAADIGIEDFAPHFDETNLFLTSYPVQTLSLKVDLIGVGGILFFKTITGDFYLVYMYAEIEFEAEDLHILRFSTQQEFLVAVAELLNDWNPDFYFDDIEFSSSTEEDVAHAISMVIQ